MFGSSRRSFELHNATCIKRSSFVCTQKFQNYCVKFPSKHIFSYSFFSWRSVLTSSVLNTFPPSFIGDECVNIIEMCISLETNVSEILKNLGLCLSLVEMQTSQAKDVWLKVWPEIKKISNREAYLNCCQVWIEFVVKFFGVIFFLRAI